MLEQRQVCSRFDAEFIDSPTSSVVGISRNVGSDLMPVNGMRVPPSLNSNGWFVWQGETLSQADDFFQPVHTAHLHELCPSIIKYLGLPPGWRFLVAGDFEDVWFDPNLLVSPTDTDVRRSGQ